LKGLGIDGRILL